MGMSPVSCSRLVLATSKLEGSAAEYANAEPNADTQPQRLPA